MSGGPSEVDRVRSLREVLTATGAGVYLSTHVAGPIPAETMAAVHESDDLELRIGRVGPDREDDLEQRHKEARGVAAAAVKASPERVILTHGVAEAVALVALEVLAHHAPVDAGSASRVVVLPGIDASVLAALEGVAAACGSSVEQLEAAPQILAADVALVVMAQVDAVGNLADVSRVGDAARKAGARLLVDASLSIGAIPLEAASCGADILVADANRWLLGPDAVTLVWLSPDLGEETPQRLRSAVGPFGRAAMLALARSVGWLLMYIELPWVLTRTDKLAQRLYEDLGAIDGIEVMADPGARAALAAFRIRDWDAVQAAEELSRSAFAIVDVDAELDVVRASVGAWNREDELDRFIERVAALAEHTPETLPRKPSLTILSGPTLVQDGE